MKKKIIMYIADTHIPYIHNDYIDFVKAVKKKYKPQEIYHLGDLIDNHAISYHESSPELFSAGDELEMSKDFIQELGKVCPKMVILQGNHDRLPIRKARTAGLPSRWIKENSEVFDMPKGWIWKNEHTAELGDGRKVWIRHQFCANPLDMAIRNDICIAQGHYHNKGRIDSLTDKYNNVWAMTVGCGIDDKSRAYEYNKLDKERPVLNVCVSINGIPYTEWMILDEENNWIGELK